ncbi:hypothetical protein [Neglectibacter timonensis]|uniref:hypothetical protein n=1 Tax=Neglectibacter timonensis TaxID=1776382 RepID=UPI0039A12284
MIKLLIVVTGGQSPSAPTLDCFHSGPSSNPDGRFPPRYASKQELEAAIDAHIRDQAAVQAETADTSPAPTGGDPQNDKNDAEQPKPVDLRTDTEKERDHGVF